jgi:hypothetical protein
LARWLVVWHADVAEKDICASRKTVETVSGFALSLFTAINRGVNEKVILRACINMFIPA